MIYRKLDEHGDYVFGGNKNSYIAGAAAAAQAIKTRLKLLKYEWWEDAADGLPLWQKILAGRDKAGADREVKARILGARDVTGMSDFKSRLDDEARRYAFTATVFTAYGNIELSEEVGM